MFSLWVTAALLLISVRAEPTWVSLPMNVPANLSDLVANSPTVPTLFGTPPQVVNATLDLNTAKLAVYSADCILCSGNSSFDLSLSTSFQSLDYPWSYSTRAYFGNMSRDTLGFDGLLFSPQTEFALIETGGDPTLAYLLYNGRLGIFPDPLNATAASTHFLSKMYQSGQLLNPVVGMRFDPANPKITIGALDPNDYQGNLNWVPLQTPNETWTYKNLFVVDGLKGYNGSFLPDSENVLTTVDSVFVALSMPNVNLYLENQGFSGPVSYNIEESDGLISYVCNTTTLPNVALTATINGVDYPITSAGNLLRPISPLAPAGYCNVGLQNKTTTPPYNLNFGLPFLRSVYLAFRFPTENCPGFYGFAFPAEPTVNPTVVSQTPTSTPTNSAQCLVFTTPTATPQASFSTAQKMRMSSATYPVYASPDQAPVALLGEQDLSAVVWNSSGLQY